MIYRKFESFTEKNYRDLIFEYFSNKDKYLGTGKYFYFKNKISFGSINDDRAFCNQIHIGSVEDLDNHIVDGIVFNIIYNRHYDDLYNTYGYKWTSISEYEIIMGDIENTRDKFEVISYDDIYKKIYLEMNKEYNISLNKEYSELSISHRNILNTIDKKRKSKQDYIMPLSDRITLEKYNYFNDKYSRGFEKPTSFTGYKKFLNFNEKEYSEYLEKEKQENKLLQDLLSDINFDEFKI